jgi:hypothetical protein
MKKRLKEACIFSLCMIFTVTLINAQTTVPGDLIWYTFQGGELFDGAYGVDRDSDGNLYIVGHSDTEWDMTGQTSVMPVNQHNDMIHDNRRLDVFVAKFTPDGNLIWHTFIGDGGSNDYGWDIAVDADGEVFVVGQTTNWYLYNPVLNSWSEENRAFLAKFDNDGNFLWMHKMGRRDSPADMAAAVDIDASGNVYVMGSNTLGWKWDDGAGTITDPLNPYTDAYGYYFIARFNNGGNYQWHTFIGPHAIGGNANGGNMDIVVKGSDIYLTGASYFRMSIPGVVPAIDHDDANSEGDRVCQEGFVLKMNNSGSVLWYTYLGYDYDAAPLNSGDGAWPNGIDADLAGNIYITGNSPRNFRYPHTSPIHPKYNFGDTDCFIMKINSNKNTNDCIEWNTFWSYGFNDRGEDIKLDDYGNILVGANGLSSSNVIFMLDNNGYQKWLRGLWDYPGTGNLHSIVLGPSGSLFFCGHGGYWSSTLGGTLIHPHYNYDDAYLAKMHTGVDYTAPPTLYVDKEVVTVTTGNYVENTGRVFHPDFPNISLSVDVGNIEKNPDETWRWYLNPASLALGFHPVTVTATDGNGKSSEITFNLQIVDNPDGERMAQALWWLVRQQRNDGSWGGLPFYPDYLHLDEPVTSSGWALMTLCQHAYVNGFLPFNEDYPYVQYIQSGLDYLFSMADKPLYDSDGTHLFVYEFTESADWRELGTAAALLGICATETPNRIIDYPDNPLVDGLSYLEFAQKIVNHLYHFQIPDENNDYYGGWDQWDFHTGHIVSALGFAETFGCSMPGDLKVKLNTFVDHRNSSVYSSWPKQYRMTNAANLMMEMAFLGDDYSTSSRAQSALQFIENTWPIPRPDPDPDNGFDGQWTDKNLELFNVLMRGLACFDLETITVDGVQVNWYDVLYDETIHHTNQNVEEGYWGASWGGDRLLNTCWALLTLYKIVPDYDNNAPIIDVNKPQVASDYSAPIENSGTFYDEDDETLFLDATLGEVIDNGDETWSWSLNTVLNNGTYNIRISAYDGHGGFAETTFQLTINSTNQPPVITCPDDQQFNANVNCSYAGSIGLATAIDDSGEDPTITNDAPQYFPLGETVVTWVATDNFGFTSTCTQIVYVFDNEDPKITAPLDVTVSTDAGSCDATGVALGTPTTSDNCTVESVVNDAVEPFTLGTTMVTWTVKDKAGNTMSCSQSVTVTDDDPPVISCPDDLTVETNNGCTFDGSIGTATATDNCTEIAAISISNDAPAVFQLGETIVTWTATDVAGNSVSGNQTIIVNDNTPPVITGVPAEIVQTNDPGQCGANVYYPDISASDNCQGAVTLEVTPASGSFFPVGSTPVYVLATDECGNTTTASFNVMVTDNEPPSIRTAQDHITMDNDAGICGASITLESPDVSDNCGISNVENDAPPVFPVGQTTVVTWTVTDIHNNQNTATVLVEVVNYVPQILSISAPLDPVPIHTAIDVSATYVDNNLDYSTWDWGDGSTSDGTIGTEITGTHTYYETGVFTLTLTIWDLCNEMATATYEQYIVVYDPSAGFVTGGGWINSPAGASTLYPDATGKANFGFVSKYKRGSTVPTGNTEFQFKAGDLNFNSNVYDWLVIAGAKAMFKGEGTINGTGAYGFMISAIDGDLFVNGGDDRLRMKIWDLVNEELVVYDNQTGDEEDADPVSGIGGGSIVIHTGNKNKSEVLPTDGAGDGLLSLEIYPNPFSNTAYIELKHDKSTVLLINVYDLTGKLLDNLYDGWIEENVDYSFEFNPDKDLNSGTYIIRFVLDNDKVITKQLILQK